MPTGRQVLDQLFNELVVGLVHHSNGRVSKLIGHGIPKNEYLDNGHAKKDHQGSGIPQYVKEFFFDEGDEGAHGNEFLDEDGLAY